MNVRGVCQTNHTCLAHCAGSGAANTTCGASSAVATLGAPVAVLLAPGVQAVVAVNISERFAVSMVDVHASGSCKA